MYKQKPFRAYYVNQEHDTHVPYAPYHANLYDTTTDILSPFSSIQRNYQTLFSFLYLFMYNIASSHAAGAEEERHTTYGPPYDNEEQITRRRHCVSFLFWARFFMYSSRWGLNDTIGRFVALFSLRGSPRKKMCKNFKDNKTNMFSALRAESQLSWMSDSDGIGSVWPSYVGYDSVYNKYW